MGGDGEKLKTDGFGSWAKNLRASIAHGVMGDWDTDEAWADGVRAYAQKQAWIRRQQALVWEKQFTEAREEGLLFMKYHGPDGISTEPLAMLTPDADQSMVKGKKTKQKKSAKSTKRKT